MTPVHELTNAMRHIEVDTVLVFPNVQTCVAVVAVVGNRLVGAHVTLSDRRRLSEVANAVGQRGAASEVFVVGPIVPNYNVNGFANFSGRLRVHDCPGFIDVRATAAGGSASFETKPHGSGDAAYQAIPPAAFVG